MRVRFGLPLWALLFAVPVAVLAINCGPANLDADNAVVQNDDVKQVVDTNVAADDATIDDNANQLSLDDGAADSWRRRGYWGGYGYGYGGWGGSWWNPYLYSSSYYYPSYGYGYGWY